MLSLDLSNVGDDIYWDSERTRGFSNSEFTLAGAS
jgi:hypothetical protein